MEIGYLGLPIGIRKIPDVPITYSTESYLKLTALRQLEFGRGLAERLRSDGRVNSLVGKILATGNGGALLENAELLILWFLWRINNAGPVEAAADLERYLASETVECIDALWLYGITTDQAAEVINGVQLLPLDQMIDSDEKERYTQQRIFNDGLLPLPSCALVTRRTIIKAYSNEDHYDQEKEKNSAPHTLYDIALLLNCLPNVFCAPGFFTSYLPPETPPGPLSGRSGSRPMLEVLPRWQCRMQEGSLTILGDLFEGFNRASKNEQHRLRSSIQRLYQAKARLDDRESPLDLGISLEMLLLNNENTGAELPGQLSLHFKLRGSWLVGKDAADRHSVYKTLNDVYAYRSQIAHNGYAKDLNKMTHEEQKEKLSEHFAIAERILQKLLIEGPSKDWKALVLGAAMIEPGHLVEEEGEGLPTSVRPDSTDLPVTI